MAPEIETLIQAFAYATFSNTDVRSATERHLAALGAELTAAGFEPGVDVELSNEELKVALNTADADKEVERPQISGAEEEDEDEFAGLGEDDEEE